MEVQEIWPVDTGILDLPPGWEPLAVATMREVERDWLTEKDRIGPEMQQFTAELHREWAIETGQIENLYDLERGVTLTLIEQGFDAAVIPHGGVNKDPEYVRNLLQDQQHALEGLFAFVKQDRALTVGYIKELHAAMTRSQTSVTAFTVEGQPIEVPMLHGEWKNSENFPRRNGTVYRYCPPEHTASEMSRLVDMHQKHQAAGVAPEVEAAWLHHRFTQIHPFQDGNGRVARALATLVFIRANLFPLVVPRDDKDNYLENLERADAGNLRSLVLMMVRLQQTRLRRAKVALARSKPPPDTVAEAVRLFGEVLAEQDATMNAQQARYAVQVADWFEAEVSRQTQNELSVLRSVNPSLRTQISRSDNWPLSDDIRTLVQRGTVSPSSIPASVGTLVSVMVSWADHKWIVLLLTCPLLNDVDQRLVSYAVLSKNDVPFARLDLPFLWEKAAYRDTSISEHAQGWLSNVLKAGFTHLAHNV